MKDLQAVLCCSTEPASEQEIRGRETMPEIRFQGNLIDLLPVFSDMI